MTSTTQLGRNLADFRKGTRTKTVLTLVGRQMLVARQPSTPGPGSVTKRGSIPPKQG